MIRKLFTALSVMLLALCVVTVVLWLRSRSATDIAPFGREGARWRAVSSEGRVFIDDQPQVDVDVDTDMKLFRDNRRRWHVVAEYREAIATGSSRVHSIFMEIFHGYDRVVPKSFLLSSDWDYWIFKVGFYFKMTLLKTSMFVQDLEKVPYDAETRKLDLLSNESDRYLNARIRIESLSVRHFWLVAGFGLLPTIWTVGYLVGLKRRRNRRNAGLCLICGYDRRQSPDRCPECGALPKSRNATETKTAPRV